MNCSYFKKKLSRYQDGELDRETRGKIQEHLEHCPGCRREYSVLTALRDILAFPLPDREFPSVAPAVMEAVRRKSSPGSRHFFARAGIFLATLVVFIAVVILFNGWRPIPGNMNSFDDDAHLLALVIDKEQTSVVGVSQDLVESLLPAEVNNEW